MDPTTESDLSTYFGYDIGATPTDVGAAPATGTGSSFSFSSLLSGAQNLLNAGLSANQAIQAQGGKTAADKAAAAAAAAKSKSTATLSTMWPWIVGGISGLLLITGLVLLFRGKSK